MNKKMKRILTLALALIMMVSVTIMPASAAWWDKEEIAVNPYPTVLVHGLLGWGYNDGINNVVPYWGMTSGNMQNYLEDYGYETYAASVGPISSAWDRACELYAQLVGGTVDYGAAHSAEFGHDRYGITYDKPLFEGWSAEKKINLVGHSFGGATIRLFLDILADGAAEEMAAAPEDCSEFFKGGKEDWVFSMTTLAAPHNGTTFIEANDDATVILSDICVGMSKALGMTELKGIYDFQLEHFGIYGDYNETPCDTLERVLSSDFLAHGDHAWVDLSIDGAFEINENVEVRENIYYFSYAGDFTFKRPFTGKYAPKIGMFALFVPFSNQMCKYYDKYTANGYYIGKEWLPNDGMVNTISALHPTKSDNSCLKADGTPAFMDYAGADAIVPGTWNVMPAQEFDHLGFCGGIFNAGPYAVQDLFEEMMKNMDDAYIASIA